jgi:hypothetical protein
MDVVRPIFIVGAGRSGSTVVQTLLSEHPDLAWVTILAKRFPDKPSWHRRLLNAIDSPFIGSVVSRRVAPSECFDYWEHHARGFRRTCRNLVAADVTEQTRKNVRRAMSELLTAQRRRLVLKATGWSRIGFIREIFPDAKFIHVLRDGRAVSNSFLNIDWWLGWQGPQNWRYGDLPPALASEWERHGKSFVALAAIQWKIIIASVEEGRRTVDPGNFFELRYERLCDDPVGTMQQVATFAGLDFTPAFARSVASHSLRSMNERWRQELTPAQQAILEDVLAGTLARNGYVTPAESASAREVVR